jgi:regulator of sigma E protease
VHQADAALFRKIGFIAPFSPAHIGTLVPDGAAQAAGLQSGDMVRQVDGVLISDGAQLRDWIRQSGKDHEPEPQHWRVERQGRLLELLVTPRRERDGTEEIGRVGAMIGATPRMVLVRFGMVQSVQRALTKTWEVSALSLRMMAQIATGISSYKNLSGPITIADYAGRSAAMGLTQFITFLALVSISLGILNLLPVPVLDGGHLMYYLWEGVTGRSISPAWMARLQRVGVAMLFVMMSVAIFNDISRFLS